MLTIVVRNIASHPAILLVLFLLVGTPSPISASDADFRVWPQAAPAFTLPSIAGGSVRLDERRGRIVLVHFFATWCAPCREELPALQRFAARVNPAEVEVLIVSVAEPDDRVRRFIDSMAFGLPILLDRDRAVTKGWDIAVLPSTVVLGPDLQPRLGVEADVAWDAISPAQLIERARQNAPSAPQTDQPPQGG